MAVDSFASSVPPLATVITAVLGATALWRGIDLPGWCNFVTLQVVTAAGAPDTGAVAIDASLSDGAVVVTPGAHIDINATGLMSIARTTHGSQLDTPWRLYVTGDSGAGFVKLALQVVGE